MDGVPFYVSSFGQAFLAQLKSTKKRQLWIKMSVTCSVNNFPASKRSIQHSEKPQSWMSILHPFWGNAVYKRESIRGIVRYPLLRNRKGEYHEYSTKQ